jgi:RNA polymerase sigma factor (sigma-70 family)
MLNNETIENLLGAITGTVGRIMGRKYAADVEDIANDTMVALVAGGLERHNGTASLKAYAMTSARNNAIDFMKRHRNKNHDSVSATDETAGEGETCGVTLEGPDGRNTVERSSQESALEFALECLLDAQESRFMTALLAGATATAAGKAEGWSKPTASRRQKELTAYLAEYVASGKWEE